MTFKIYRLYRRPIIVSETHPGQDCRSLGNWKATEITFKARTEKEAMRKANKFWQFGDFGMGSIKVQLINN